MENYLKIGKIGKAHGLRGLFFVADRFDPLPSNIQKVFLKNSDLKQNELMSFEIKSLGIHQGKPIMSFKNLLDRTQLEPFMGCELYILRSDLKLDPQTDFLWKDLISKKVFDRAGTYIGLVEKVYNLGASDILQVKAEKDGYYDIPLISNFFQMATLSQNSENILLSVDTEIVSEFWNQKG
jgi:16S rRNA processing protein RimM